MEKIFTKRIVSVTLLFLFLLCVVCIQVLFQDTLCSNFRPPKHLLRQIEGSDTESTIMRTKIHSTRKLLKSATKYQSLPSSKKRTKLKQPKTTLSSAKRIDLRQETLPSSPKRTKLKLQQPLPSSEIKNLIPNQTFSPLPTLPRFEGARGCFEKLKKLKSVVYAVNFNNPYYESIPMIKRFYEPIFGVVMFCGDKRDTANNLYHTPLNSKREGYQGYMCLKLAMELYPDYEGYFYSNDDVILNWWQIIDFDLTKIWLGENFLPWENRTRKLHKFGEPIRSDWHWWLDVDAAHLCEVAFNKTGKFSKTKKGRSIGMSKYMSNYYAISKGNKLCHAAFSDVFYLPKQYRDVYMRLSQIWGYTKVFLETAVPTILSFFMNVTEQNFVQLNGEYYVLKTGYSDPYYSGHSFYEYYGFHLTFIHPVKFGNSPMAKANKFYFENVVKPYGDLFYDYCKERGVAKSFIEIENSRYIR